MTTEVMPPVQREATAAKDSSGRLRWIIIGVLALGWLAGVLWRLWLGNPITHPIAHTDEDSYINAARAIAGGPGGFSSETPLFRRVGYPLLISPAFMFGLDFATSYKIVQVVNAAISALSLPLAYLLARRMFGLKTWVALAAAFVAATMPAGTFWSLVGMTDAVMAPLMLGWLLAVHWWLGEPARKGAAITVGVLTGVLYMVHIRGTILAVVFFAFLAFLIYRRKATWRTAALPVVPLALLVVLNQIIIVLLGDKVHVRGDIVGGGTLEVFTSVQRLQVFFGSLGTNIWYMCVVTAGLAGIGWAVATLEMFRPKRDLAYRWTGGLALFSTLGVALGAALILAGLPVNADAIYSRYVQTFVPFWILFGFAVLVDSRLRAVARYAVVPVLVLAAGGGLIAYRLHHVAEQGHKLSYGTFGGPDIITITAGWTHFRPLVGTAIGLIGLAVIVAATRVRQLWIPTLALLVVANAVTMVVMRDRIIEPLGEKFSIAIDLRELGVGPGDKVAFSAKMTNEGYFVMYHDVYWQDVTFLPKGGRPPADVDVVIGRYLPSRPDLQWPAGQFGFKLLKGSGLYDAQIGVWRRQ
ncbi:hypothetical protein [Paractinoplanes atraurantiacus]|uniref:4-amino-4-deoxy-L-arabinose transferase n=1 Tax=Paractinoplanes atraurantiacus TaxID=1036182 RepID=A0A285F7Q8_9ACTN|nr:hypothetical protein [Actinoplanes atraurantiacus]SNY06251.1 hypothetical protein SAMN05421748_101658 [Actinoplanes atraurantiacus]